MAEIIIAKETEDIEEIEDNSDIKIALAMISEFWDVHSCVIVKNEIPVGAALSAIPYDAKIKALDCNPIEAVGATIAFSKQIDLQTAKALSRMDFHTVITTKIEKDAKEFLIKSKSRVIEIGFRLD